MRRASDLAPDRLELEMTPMIDVTFLLLIFFLCTLRFKTLEGLLGAHLPRDGGVLTDPALPPPEPVEVTLRVIAAGTRLAPDGRPWSGQPGRRFVYGDDRVIEYSLGPWHTTDLEILEARARELRRAKAPLSEEPVRATIDALEGTIHDDVMAVLDRLAGAGFERVALVGARGD